MRRSKATVLLVTALVLVAGCSKSDGKGSEPAPSTGPTSTIELSTSSTTSTTTSTSTTTTAPPTTTTTIDAAALYAEIDAEVQRACTEAVDSGQLPKPEFHTNWEVISTPEKLAAAVQSCIAARQAAPG